MKTLSAIIALFIMTTQVVGACEYTRVLNESQNYEARIRYTIQIARNNNQMKTVAFQGEDNAYDNLSLDCMSCHTGGIAPMVQNEYSHCESKSNANPIGKSHTIGADYNYVSFRKSGYVNTQNLPSTIKLINGKVSCVTCHEILNNEPMHLRVTMEGSQLCFSCHAK